MIEKINIIRADNKMIINKYYYIKIQGLNFLIPIFMFKCSYESEMYLCKDMRKFCIIDEFFVSFV